MRKEKIVRMLEDIIKKDFEFIKFDKIDDNLIEGGMSSIAAIKLIVTIEKTFGFAFYDEDLLIENFSTLRKLSDYVYNRLNN